MRHTLLAMVAFAAISFLPQHAAACPQDPEFQEHCDSVFLPGTRILPDPDGQAFVIEERAAAQYVSNESRGYYEERPRKRSKRYRPDETPKQYVRPRYFPEETPYDNWKPKRYQKWATPYNYTRKRFQPGRTQEYYRDKRYVRGGIEYDPTPRYDRDGGIVYDPPQRYVRGGIDFEGRDRYDRDGGIKYEGRDNYDRDGGYKFEGRDRYIRDKDKHAQHDYPVDENGNRIWPSQQ